MRLKWNFVGRNVRGELKKSWFHIALLVSFSLSITLLMVLDYLNLESILFSASLNQEFRFLSTWKGRMFYLFFLWLLFIESIIDWGTITEKKPKNRFRISVFFVCAAIPLIYVLGVNFWGLDQIILNLGQDFGLTDSSLDFHWILCVEYIVFATTFLVAILLAYGKEGLGFSSMGLSLLMGMSIMYAIDTFYPGGAFRPFEMLALPTAACAAAILDILGYTCVLYFDTRYVHPTYGLMPTINGVSIAWPCAGVHSLFLFTIIILLFFKRSSILAFRKFIYFVVGALGTYFVNVLRIVSYFVILWNNGKDAANFFHNSIGELYFFSWIFIFILIIVSIERFMLVDKVRYSVQKLRYFLGNMKDKFLSFITENAK